MMFEDGNHQVSVHGLAKWTFLLMSHAYHKIVNLFYMYAALQGRVFGFKVSVFKETLNSWHMKAHIG